MGLSPILKKLTWPFKHAQLHLNPNFPDFIPLLSSPNCALTPSVPLAIMACFEDGLSAEYQAAYKVADYEMLRTYFKKCERCGSNLNFGVQGGLKRFMGDSSWNVHITKYVCVCWLFLSLIWSVWLILFTAEVGSDAFLICSLPMDMIGTKSCHFLMIWVLFYLPMVGWASKHALS